MWVVCGKAQDNEEVRGAAIYWNLFPGPEPVRGEGARGGADDGALFRGTVPTPLLRDLATRGRQASPPGTPLTQTAPTSISHTVSA